jgi:hypothetical protein
MPMLGAVGSRMRSLSTPGEAAKAWAQLAQDSLARARLALDREAKWPSSTHAQQHHAERQRPRDAGLTAFSAASSWLTGPSKYSGEKPALARLPRQQVSLNSPSLLLGRDGSTQRSSVRVTMTLSQGAVAVASGR